MPNCFTKFSVLHTVLIVINLAYTYIYIYILYIYIHIFPVHCSYFIMYLQLHASQGGFCLWTFFVNTCLNSLPCKFLVSGLHSPLGYSAGMFDAMWMVVIAVFLSGLTAPTPFILVHFWQIYSIYLVWSLYLREWVITVLYYINTLRCRKTRPIFFF